MTRRLRALAAVLRRSSALADARDENVAMAMRVAYLEGVIAQQGRHVIGLRRDCWRYWSEAQRACHALAELEPVVTGERS